MFSSIIRKKKNDIIVRYWCSSYLGCSRIKNRKNNKLISSLEILQWVMLYHLLVLALEKRNCNSINGDASLQLNLQELKQSKIIN